MATELLGWVHSLQYRDVVQASAATPAEHSSGGHQSNPWRPFAAGEKSHYDIFSVVNNKFPMEVMSFCYRSGRNDCVISSGIKSCIPCRLQKCLQVRTIY